MDVNSSGVVLCVENHPHQLKVVSQGYSYQEQQRNALWFCNICKQTSWKGKKNDDGRYRCGQCWDWDACPTCAKTLKYSCEICNQSLKFVTYTAAGDWFCNICRGYNKGFRFRCHTCSDFDMCSMCVISSLLVKSAAPLCSSFTEQPPLCASLQPRYPTQSEVNAMTNEELLDTAAKAQETLQFIEKEKLRRLNTSNICKICDDHEISCVFLPCSHSCCCEDCKDHILRVSSTCPICRSCITEAVKLIHC